MVQFVSCWVLVPVLLAIHSSLCPTFSSNRFEVSCFRLRSLILISNKSPGLSSICLEGAALCKVIHFKQYPLRLKLVSNLYLKLGHAKKR